MEALEPSGFDDSVTFPTGADIDLIREAITFRHRDMSCFGPQHLQELLLAFQYLLCSTAWEPRIYSLAALLSIPLIGSALAAEQLITDIIDRDVAHELSDLCGRDINEVKALQDSLIFTPCKSIFLLNADRKEDILGPSPIVDKALDFWRTFLYRVHLLGKHLSQLIILAFPTPIQISCPSSPTPRCAGLSIRFFAPFSFICGNVCMGDSREM